MDAQYAARAKLMYGVKVSSCAELSVVTERLAGAASASAGRTKARSDRASMALGRSGCGRGAWGGSGGSRHGSRP